MRGELTITTRTVIGALVWLFTVGTPASTQNAAQQAADVKPGDIRVVATAAIRGPLEAVRADAEKAIGHRIVIQFGSARGNLRTALLGGQAFDVAILVPDVNEELVKQGKATAGIVDFARVDPAIGLRGNVPAVDVSTPVALKEALLKAKSIWWSDTGTSSPTVNKVFDTLGIREAVKPKHDPTGKAVLGPGEYQLHIRALSEILDNKELRPLGPVPPELLVPTVLGAVVSATTLDAASANALVKFLQGPGMDAALTASGMRRP